MTAIPDRAALLERNGTLLVTHPRAETPIPEPGAEGSNRPQEVDIFLAVLDDGTVLAFNGHVDLGTGIRTALAQIVAEELDVAFERVTMVLGDTERAPDQGATIASETIQITAIPLRLAAAQARALLVAEAAIHLATPVEELQVDDGVVHHRHAPAPGVAPGVAYAELLGGRRIHVSLDEAASPKPVAHHRVVGTSVPRTDIPAKALGTFSYVHDLRVPGMVHGRVIRPPYLGHDSGPFVGRSLAGIDENSVADIPGLIAVVAIGDFVGVVALREEHADRAMRALRVHWKPFTPGADLSDVETAVRADPGTRRMLLDKGDVQSALAGSATRMDRTYGWPYQMHGSIGPSCAVANHAPGRLVVWSGTQNPHMLRTDLARLMELPEHQVEVERMEAAGCYGRNCADDVSGDAALLSRAVGLPVRVQLTREQEHAWEPKGAAQVCDVSGGQDAAGNALAYDFVSRYPSNLAPMLPLLLTGMVSPEPVIAQMGDRTAIPPYDYPAMRIAVDDIAPILRASWMRGVSALPNTFAHECFIDEMAAQARVDPVEYRLRYLHEPRAVELVEAVAARAGWQPRTEPRREAEGDILRGQGFAYALYVHSKFPGFGAAWAAWVADVEVNRRTGEVTVAKVTVGQDTGLMINPDGVRHQLHGNVIQSTSRALMERVNFDTNAVVASREWGGYPIMTFRDIPEIDVMLMHRPEEPPLGAGESASVPSAAAIANAIYDATGVRFRTVPFTADVILAGLAGTEHPAALPPPSQPPPQPPHPPPHPPPTRGHRRRWLARLAGLGAALGMAITGLAGLHAAFPATTPPGADVFSASLIERGRLLAAAGDCAVCHTAPGGPTNAGGHALHTPFGTVYATNLTPDIETGIGAYSYAAFERAMRQGIGRDGRNLYPAFPYTSFTKMTDSDLLALYAYLMAQTPVRAQSPQTRLAFPANLRPLMAGWNLLFHRPGPDAPDSTRSAQWNRGNYLVNALGHCGACHTPRNALGAERQNAYLQGAIVDGWQAPPIAAASHAPIAWTEQALYDYLRHGHAQHHGVAAGPMGPVVAELQALPDSDIAAMANYLAAQQGLAKGAGPESELAAQADALETQAWTDLPSESSQGARLFQGACASCHHRGDGPAILGVNVALSLSSSLHADRPDNLIHVILQGIARPATPQLGHMPGFAASLNDAQLADLVGFLRARFAAAKPAWRDIAAEVARIRSSSTAAAESAW